MGATEDPEMTVWLKVYSTWTGQDLSLQPIFSVTSSISDWDWPGDNMPR